MGYVVGQAELQKFGLNAKHLGRLADFVCVCVAASASCGSSRARGRIRIAAVAYTIATATLDPSYICLRHSLLRSQMPNLSEGRD